LRISGFFLAKARKQFRPCLDHGAPNTRLSSSRGRQADQARKQGADRTIRHLESAVSRPNPITIVYNLGSDNV
jgi:hypothetical protein